jgi:hypothetical protein
LSGEAIAEVPRLMVALCIYEGADLRTIGNSLVFGEIGAFGGQSGAVLILVYPKNVHDLDRS